MLSLSLSLSLIFSLSLSSARDGSLYATRRDQIYKFNRNGVGIESGFPKKTRKVYKRAPKSAGAAVQDRYGRVYMFKGWQSFLLETVMFYREIVLLSFHSVFSMSAIQILCIININNIIQVVRYFVTRTMNWTKAIRKESSGKVISTVKYRQPSLGMMEEFTYSR